MDKWSLRDVFLFAKAAHEGQTRKFSGEPYINHPVRVALMAVEHGLSIDDVAAALLHDVVEDCDVSLDEIVARFGRRVGSNVWGLTNYEARNGGPDDTMNRAARKAADRIFLSAQEPGTKSVKFCDGIDNMQDWPRGDRFLDRMLDELCMLAQDMSAAGIDGPTGGVHTDLIERFWDVYNDAREQRLEETNFVD